MANLDSIGELLRRARAGEGAAQDKLFHDCRNYLNVVARCQVESWLRAKVDASDLVQQTLMEAHRDFERFDGQTEAEWLAWLRRILAHNATDFVRRFGGAKRQARREISLDMPATMRWSGKDTPLLEPSDPGETPSQQLIREESQLRMTCALMALSADHREVILLRNLQRLAFDEVAERMNRTRPAVQMLWMRAIRRLREILHEGGDDSVAGEATP